MAIERGLYSAPLGEEMSDEEAFTVGIGTEYNPSMIELEEGEVEINFTGEEDETPLQSLPFDVNLAEYIDEDDLNALVGDLQEQIAADQQSRKEWEDTLVEGLDLLGLQYEERTEPWEGACGVYSSVLNEAAIRFQAEAMSESFPAAGPVRTKILGDDNQDTQKAASRVAADMNYELTERMIEYRPEHERLLYSLGVMGSAFKKVYFDPTLARQTAVYLSAEDVLVPFGASHTVTAERITHIMRKTKHEMDVLQSKGFYRDIELDDPEPCHSRLAEKKAETGGYELTDDERYALYEVHTTLHLPGLDDEDQPAKPYVVTFVHGSDEVMAIRRNWEEGDEEYRPRQHFVHYAYMPGFGFYGLGLVHIIGGYARAGTALIRQLVDAGTLSNLPGGLKARGVRVTNDDTPIEPGEFRDTDVPSGTLKENVMPLPYKEPSQVLAALLDKIIDEGRRLAAVSELNVADMSNNAPVGTTLALLERTLKPMAAVQARVHYSMKQEFKLLKGIIAAHASDQYSYTPESGDRLARRQDYEMVEVIPVSDPNSSTMTQRIVQYQAALQLSEQAPQIYDLPFLHRQMIEVLGIKDADKVVPLPEDQKPKDPISENMGALVGKPIKAFLYQDHDAHIAAHTAFMQDPMVQQMIGQNPQANQIMAALQAHLAEHLGFKYRRQIEERLGVSLPAPDEEMPQEIELQLSRVVAQAGQQLLQTHQQQAAQQQAQEEAQDPHLQLERAKLQLEKAELERKTANDAAEQQLKQRELEIRAKEAGMKALNEKDKIQATRDTARMKARTSLAETAMKEKGASNRRDKKEKE